MKSEDDRDSKETVQEDSSSVRCEARSPSRDSEPKTISCVKNPPMAVLKRLDGDRVRNVEDLSGTVSTFSEDSDDNDSATMYEKIRTLKTEMNFDHDLSEHFMEERIRLTSFEEDPDTDPLDPSPTSDLKLTFEDIKPDINILSKCLKRMKDPFNIGQEPTRSSPAPSVVDPQPSTSKQHGDIMDESMDSYIFSDSSMDIYSAKLADERRESTSLTSMKNVMSQISCSSPHNTRSFEVIDSMLYKLDSNVSLLGKMNKRNVLSDPTVLWSNEKTRLHNTDEQSSVDVILNLHPALTKVGPINVYHKNGSFVYRCKIEDCRHFYTLNLDLLQRHVLSEHIHYSFDDWICTDCDNVRTIDTGIRDIMQHLVDSHSLRATSQIALDRLKSSNESILKDIQSAGECPIRKDAGNADACQLFQCCIPNCTFSTDSSVDAINHFNIKLDGRVNFTCKYCSTQVNAAYEYAKHLINHHGESQYKCGYCFYRGVTKATIYFHQLVKHPLTVVKIFRCRIYKPFQDERTPQEPTYKVHLVQCICPHCKFNTTILEKFKRHLTEMHPFKGFTCFLCGNSSTDEPTGVIEHLLEHGIGEFQCRFCQQGFTDVTSVRRHISREHPEKYPFVILRRDYFGTARAQYCRTKEIPLGFESILGVDLGSDSVCENQLQVIDMSGMKNVEDIAKQMDFHFNPEKEVITLSDGKKVFLALPPVAIPSSTTNPTIQQIAKKTTPSPIKLVPLSKLVNEPSLPSTSELKVTTRKRTRSNPPVTITQVPIAATENSFLALKPPFTINQQLSVPVFRKILPKPRNTNSVNSSSVPQPPKTTSINRSVNSGPLPQPANTTSVNLSVYSGPVPQPANTTSFNLSVYSGPVPQPANTTSVNLSVNSGPVPQNSKATSIVVNNTTMNQEQGARMVSTKSRALPISMTRILKPAESFVGKSAIKQTAWKPGGQAVVNPSIMQPPVVVSSASGSLQMKNTVGFINVSPIHPLKLIKAVSIVRQGTGISPQNATNISIGLSWPPNIQSAHPEDPGDASTLIGEQ